MVESVTMEDLISRWDGETVATHRDRKTGTWMFICARIRSSSAAPRAARGSSHTRVPPQGWRTGCAWPRR
jgi:hypothetical protein